MIYKIILSCVKDSGATSRVIDRTFIVEVTAANLTAPQEAIKAAFEVVAISEMPVLKSLKLLESAKLLSLK